MANKNTETKIAHSTILFALAYLFIVILTFVSAYLLYSVNVLQDTSEDVLVELRNNVKIGGDGNHREFLRNKRSSYLQPNRRHSVPIGLASAHIVGHRENRLSKGQWLTWCFENCKISRNPQNSTSCLSSLSHSDFCFDQHKIRINKAGFYFVYAQLVTTSRSNAIKSFQIVVLPGGQMSHVYPVMSSYQTQYPLGYTADNVAMESKNSAYVGGVVLLCPGDLAGVRANPENTEDITLDTSNEGSSFFGAFSVNLSSDLKYRHCTTY